MANNLRTEVGIKATLRDYINVSFLQSAGLDGFTDDDSFMESGIIDSTSLLELLEFVEETFGIQVEDEELVTANFDSMNKIAVFLRRKITNAGA